MHDFKPIYGKLQEFSCKSTQGATIHVAINNSDEITIGMSSVSTWDPDDLTDFANRLLEVASTARDRKKA
jgi:hypothetical protein